MAELHLNSLYFRRVMPKTNGLKQFISAFDWPVEHWQHLSPNDVKDDDN